MQFLGKKFRFPFPQKNPMKNTDFCFSRNREVPLFSFTLILSNIRLLGDSK